MITLHITGRDITDLACTVDFAGPHFEAAAETGLIAWLAGRGWIVTKESDNWETPGELAARLKVSSKHICRRRLSPACPHHEVVKGEQGRVLYIRPSAQLDAFITRHLKPQLKS